MIAPWNRAHVYVGYSRENFGHVRGALSAAHIRYTFRVVSRRPGRWDAPKDPINDPPFSDEYFISVIAAIFPVPWRRYSAVPIIVEITPLSKKALRFAVLFYVKSNLQKRIATFGSPTQIKQAVPEDG